MDDDVKKVVRIALVVVAVGLMVYLITERRVMVYERNQEPLFLLLLLLAMACLVVAKKIKTTADTNHEIPEPLGSRDVPSTEHRTAAQAQPLGEAVQRDLVAPVTRAQGTESVIVCPACGSSCSIRAVNCESCGHALW